jgi:hypothetical protein
MKQFVITLLAWSVAAGMCAGTAFADHDTAKKTGTIKLPLVRVFSPCASSTAARCQPGSTFGVPACPAETPATTLTLEKQGKGMLTIKVIPPTLNHPTGDIKFSANIVGVRDNADILCGTPPCPYNGPLYYYGPVNNTDDGLCGSMPASTCTLTSVCAAGDAGIGTPCTTDTDCGTGGKCTNTCTVSGWAQQGTITCTNGKCVGSGTANTSTPGLTQVNGGYGQNIELGAIQITDDACGFPPCNPFLAPGLVVP